MSFFNYVSLSDYDLTDQSMLQCCYDEVVAEYTDTGDIAMCGEQFLRDAARFKLEDFKTPYDLFIMPPCVYTTRYLE